MIYPFVSSILSLILSNALQLPLRLLVSFPLLANTFSLFKRVLKCEYSASSIIRTAKTKQLEKFPDNRIIRIIEQIKITQHKPTPDYGQQRKKHILTT